MLDDSHIQAIASGDHHSFRLLFEELEPRMLYYTYKMTGDREVSRDILQDTFILYWDRRASFDNLLASKTFFYTTIRHKIWRHVRNDTNRRRILGNVLAEMEQKDDDLLTASEICGQIRSMIRELPPQTGLIIELSMQGLTVEKIAALTNTSHNTVKSLKKAGYKTLRDKLNHLRPIFPFLF